MKKLSLDVLQKIQVLAEEAERDTDFSQEVALYVYGDSEEDISELVSALRTLVEKEINNGH